MFDREGNIYLETDNGAALKMDLDQLHTHLKPKERNALLNVDVVFVNMLNGKNVANVFKKLGVPQIFTYSLPLDWANVNRNINCHSKVINGDCEYI